MTQPVPTHSPLAPHRFRHFPASATPETVVTITAEELAHLRLSHTAPRELIERAARCTLGVVWRVSPVSIQHTGTHLRHTFTAQGRTVHVDVP